MPTINAPATLSDAGTLACASRIAQPGTSVIFQIPELRNNNASTTAAIQFTADFQPCRCRPASPGRGCAILSVMALL